MFKKYYSLSLLIFSVLLLTVCPGFAQSKMLGKGDVAPLFTAQSSLAGKEVDFSLKNALAKGPVVVYFYPSAYTGGCDAEAHAFAELKDKFKLVKVDGGVNTNIMQQQKVSALPTFIIYKNGKEVWRKQDIVEKSELIAQLSK